MLSCDVLIVGAGPAGGSAALSAARMGAAVIIIDRKYRIGIPIHCAELIPQMLLHEFPIPSHVIDHKIDSTIVWLPSGVQHVSRTPGLMIRRDLFDREILNRSLHAGARLMLGTRALDLAGNELLCIHRNHRFPIKFKVLICADGPLSSIGRRMQSGPVQFIKTLHCKIPLQQPSRTAEIFFRPPLFGGYAWMFPKKDSVNLGAGIRSNMPSGSVLLKELRNLISELAGRGLIEPSEPVFSGGLVPVSGPGITQQANILLAGDAAGQTHPITGAGIGTAVVCGKIAGEVAARSIKMQQPEYLAEYPRLWKLRFHNELVRATQRRSLMESSWNDLETTIRRCWTAFPEYYD